MLAILINKYGQNKNKRKSFVLSFDDYNKNIEKLIDFPFQENHASIFGTCYYP